MYELEIKNKALEDKVKRLKTGMIEMLNFLHDVITDRYETLEESNEFTQEFNAYIKFIEEA